MANTVKLKRGSGSDPSASDMVVGEPVIRTDTAELFFKKDDGSVAKVSGGGGGPDFKYLALRNAANNGSASYPGNDFTLVTSGTTNAITPAAANTLLVSYGGVIQKPNSGTSTSGITGFIVDGSRIKTATNLAAAPDFILYQESGGIGEPSDDTVTNAKVTSSAAIAGTKISPDFGSQVITTTGVINGKDLVLTDTHPSITYTDSDGNPDYQLKVNHGWFRIHDATNDEARLTVNSNGHIDIHGNLDCLAGVDVTGNITVTGTVDGVDIATRDTLFGGLTSSSGVLTNGVTATTQSASDNSTKIATTAYADTAISNLVNGAPAALDTLNELAAAMADDAAFSTTITNSIATKLPLAGGTLTGDTTLANTKKIIFNASSGAGAYIKHQSGHFEMISSVGNTYFAAAGTLYLRSGGSTNALTLDSSQNATFAGTATFAGGTCNGSFTVSSTEPRIYLTDTNSNSDFELRNVNGYFRIFDSTNSRNCVSIDSAGAIAVAGTIYPSVNATHNLGYNSTRWNDIYMKNDMFINDDGRICWGDGNDLQVYHSGVDSVIDKTTSGNLLIYVANDFYLKHGTEVMLAAKDDAAVELYWGGTSAGKKLETTSTGITVSGVLTLDSSTNKKLILSGSASPSIYLQEGTTDKVQIQWDNSGNYIYFWNEETNRGFQLGSDPKWYDGGGYRLLWHSGNDGAGSGLDADLWDGNQFSSYLNQGVLSTSNPTFNNIYINGWYRNNDSTEGLYNQANAQHWYSDSTSYFNLDGDGSTVGIRFRDNHASNIRGYIYANNSNQVGLLDSGGNWRFYVNSTSNLMCVNHLLPSANNTYDLGGSSNRWNNLYVNDMHFSNNPDNPNVVDGTWGDWTLQEGEENIYMINNRSGKRYKMGLVEVA